MIFIAVIGGIISYFGHQSIRAAHEASDGLRHIFDSHFAPYNPDDQIIRDHPKDVGDIPHLFYIGDNARTIVVPTIGRAGRERKIKTGTAASMTIPWVLFWGWAFAILYAIADGVLIVSKIF